MKIKYILALSMLLGVLGPVFKMSLMVNSATITVNTLIDESDGSCTDGDCSLRDAIAVANPGDTINFSVTGILIVTDSSFLSISKNLTISGPGANKLTIRRDIDTVIFYLGSSADATISGVTISGRGGGIYIDWGSTLMVSNCTFFGNHDRGGIQNQGTLTVAYSSFSGNSATLGGAIENRNMLTVNNSIFSGNSADMQGGSIDNWGGTLVITDSTFSGNSATSDGGNIYNDGTLTVTNSTFSNNNAGRWGGGLEIFSGSVTVNNSNFSGNSAGMQGGGIDNWGTLNVTHSTFSNNSSGEGGGINSFGPVNLTGSTFSGNSASSQGGGIYSSGTLTVMNSTFSANTAGDEGWAINCSGTLNVTNSTLSGNSASDGGGLYSIGSATTFKNSIIANSLSGGDCYQYTYFTGASNNNLDTDKTCTSSFTQVTRAQLALGALTGNPAYFPLKAGSVAIDAGTNSGCPATDQRGWPRPQDGDGNGTAISDVGSFEFLIMPYQQNLPLILR